MVNSTFVVARVRLLTVRHAITLDLGAALSQVVRTAAAEQEVERADRIGDVAAAVAVEVEDRETGRRHRHRLGIGNRVALRERGTSEQEIQVVAEVQEAARNLETSQQVLILQRETTSLVDQNRDLVEKEYRAGPQGSLVRLNQAQRDLTSQQASLALALVSLRQAWVDLDSATGVIVVLARAEETGDQ